MASFTRRTNSETSVIDANHINELQLSLEQRAVSVKDPLFGATGDGTTDDTTAIAATISAASAAGGGIVYFPKGSYITTTTLTVPSSVTLRGCGETAIIKASQATGWAAHSARAMIEIIGATGAAVENLVLDMQGTGRAAAKAIGQHMVLSNSKRCTIERVVFRDGGYDSAHPSGPCLALAAKDIAGDLSGAGIDSAAVGEVAHNLIRNCRFEQRTGTGGYAFAIRVISDWLNTRAPDSFTYYNHGNRIESCVFVDDGSGNGFEWNTVEFAGGGTRNNIIANCIFTGRTLTHIDFDKGCNHNIASENIITDSGKSTYYIGDVNNRFVAIQDHGNAATYMNEGNQIVNNVVRDCTSASTDTTESLIGVMWASDTLIQGNRLRNLNAAVYGYGIRLDDKTPGAIIDSNSIKGVLIGFGTDSSATSRESVAVTNNKIDCANQGIHFGGGTPGSGDEPNGVVIAHNRVKTASTTLSAIYVGAEISGPIVSENQVIGGLDGVNILAPNAVITANVMRSTNGIRAQAAVTSYIRDNYHVGTTPLLIGASSKIWMSGNAWETVLVKSADYTATYGDSVIRGDATTATFTITLPTAVGVVGKRYVIKKTDASVNSVIVDGNASETIDAAATKSLTSQHAAIEIVSDGTNWRIVALMGTVT